MSDEQRARHESPDDRIVVDGYTFTRSELEYARRHLGEWQRSVRLGGPRNAYLITAFVVGLVLYFIAGLIGTGPLARSELIADFLYNLGTTLWASVILVLFLEVFPRGQERRAKGYIRASEKALEQLGHDVPDVDPPDDDMDGIAPRLDALTRSIERLQAEVAALRDR